MSLRELHIRLRGQDYLCLSKAIVALQAICYRIDEATMMLDTRPRTFFDFKAITNPTSGMRRTSPLASRVTSLVLQRPSTRTFGLLVPTAITYVRLFLNCILYFLPITSRCTEHLSAASGSLEDTCEVDLHNTDDPCRSTHNRHEQRFPPRRFRRTMTLHRRNSKSGWYNNHTYPSTFRSSLLYHSSK
jgi:hypothetical protein